MSYRASIARPYAEAIFSIALEKNDLNAFTKLLQDLVLLLENSELLLVLNSPLITVAKKTTIITTALDLKNKVAIAFIELLLQNKRILLAQDTLCHYIDLCDRHAGVTKAHIVSAYVLPKKLQDNICQALSKQQQQQIVATYSVDKSLIAGLKVTIAEKVIDLSGQSMLYKLRKSLLNYEETNYAT